MPDNQIMKRSLLTNLFLLGTSSCLCVFVVLYGLPFFARWYGIHDPLFRYENQVSLWAPDPDIGFVNRPDFFAYCFGNITLSTNRNGFRISPKDPDKSEPSSQQIIGIGDSVMWGTSVDEQQSLLGYLRHRLEPKNHYDVVNAAVVGHSTLQEVQFFEKYILRMKPDIVLINFCVNDFLPSEDPFQNIRSIQVRYLEEQKHIPNLWTSDQQMQIDKMINILKSADNVWSMMQSGDSISSSLRDDLFILRPLEQLLIRCQENNIRLIVLLIPPRDPSAFYQTIARKIIHQLQEHEGEWLDFQPYLPSSKNSRTGLSSSPSSPFGWLTHLMTNQSLNNIARLNHIEHLQENLLYIDQFHPTRKGNAVIADHLARYIMDN